MELVNFFQQRHLSIDLLGETLNDCKQERLPKNYQLLVPGSYSKKIFFIKEGLARSYFFNKNGKDVTHCFYKENDAYAPIESLFYNKPSRYGPELLENSTIYIFEYCKVFKYKDKAIEVNKGIWMTIINSLLVSSDWMDSKQLNSALVQYNDMLENHPDILLRAPLGHIASYLGITQQTLSVIRSKWHKYHITKSL